ncbi:MAG: S-adenosylmethionine:tRNA ribosyltransferase-isomerase, partial [Rubricoccaceae bacterium]|nr:S-adenosylmethionine:tRNA ribosyltransferase-isomerase [Rubricoccaceae bacterium]
MGHSKPGSGTSKLDLRLDSYDFELPESQIAQHPVAKRDESRMLVLNRRSQTLSDHTFRDIISFIEPNDVLVLNNTKVF